MTDTSEELVITLASVDQAPQDYFASPAFVQAAATLAIARAEHVSSHIAAVVSHKPGIRGTVSTEAPDLKK